MAVAQEGKVATLVVLLVLEEVVEAQEELGQQAEMVKLLHLTLAVTEEVPLSKDIHTPMELMVIRWEVQVVKAVGRVTLVQVTAMADALNMAEAEVVAQVGLLIQTTPMTKNRVVPVFSVQAEEEAEGQEPQELVKI